MRRFIEMLKFSGIFIQSITDRHLLLILSVTVLEIHLMCIKFENDRLKSSILHLDGWLCKFLLSIPAVPCKKCFPWWWPDRAIGWSAIFCLSPLQIPFNISAGQPAIILVWFLLIYLSPKAFHIDTFMSPINFPRNLLRAFLTGSEKWVFQQD